MFEWWARRSHRGASASRQEPWDRSELLLDVRRAGVQLCGAQEPRRSPGLFCFVQQAAKSGARIDVDGVCL